jgi:hypothetical protein
MERWGALKLTQQWLYLGGAQAAPIAGDLARRLKRRFRLLVV